jgi:hypothetical protein
MNPAIVSSVSKTLAEMTVFPNWSDVANLAYWVTGTERFESLPLRHRVLLHLQFGDTCPGKAWHPGRPDFFPAGFSVARFEQRISASPCATLYDLTDARSCPRIRKSLSPRNIEVCVLELSAWTHMG